MRTVAEGTYRLAFDIGGTFTDFALLHEETGEFTVHKCLTTPQDPAEGALRGVADLLVKSRASGQQVSSAIHGTTLITNAIIERKGAKVALLTTAGFRDVLEIRNELRYDIYDLFLQFPEPLVPRYLRRGIDERIDRHGRVLREVRREDVARALEMLRVEDGRDRAAAAAQRPLGSVSAGEISALAICFLHGYLNPVNERAAAQFARQLWPGLDVVTSHEVATEVREYERTSTTVANAYVLPLTRRYLETLARALTDLGDRGGLYLMLSSGGICTLDTAAKFPVRLIESGPAGGAIGAAFFGAAAGVRDLVSFDMGGTTAKICLIQSGQPAMTRQLEVARVHRFKRGSGFPMQVPSVDITEIGAGGGSIAGIDDMGLLKVGPRSAGADPGPACYGRGGVEPTVTDADLILGYLDPEYFLGGTMRLDRAAAERAIEDKVARPLGLSLTEAARGIHQLVNENMAAAARIHVIERGRDPRRYALLAFGGAGPVHACGVARLLGQKRVICPLAAGVLSTIGFLVAPASFELAQSRPELLRATGWTEVNRLLEDLEARGRAVLRDAGLTPERIQIQRSADVRYAGQLNEIAVEIPTGVLGSDSEASITERFATRYMELYDHLLDDIPIEILTWRVVATGQFAPVRLREHTPRPGSEATALRSHRPGYWPDRGWCERVRVYDRYALAPSCRFEGPAIVEEHESTVIVPAGAVCSVDRYLTLIIDLPSPGKGSGGDPRAAKEEWDAHQ